MNRWGVRILGIVLLLLFSLVFVQLYKQLKMMERMQQQNGASGAVSR
jgi:hypothetical protein